MKKKYQYKRGSFLCTVCGLTCTTNYSLNDHMRTHTGEKPYTCQVCGVDQPCRAHPWKNNQKFRSVICPICSKTFRQSSLSTHLKTHDTRPCEICGETFATKKLRFCHMAVHARADRALRVFTCLMCDKVFKNKKMIREHMYLHERKLYDTASLDCPICGKKIVGEYRLRIHIGSNHDITRKSLCTLCGTYVGKSDMKSHMQKHSGVKPFQCKICGRGIGRAIDFKRHMAIVHADGPLPPKYVCPHCGRGFQYPQAFRQHLLVHSDVFPFECEVCQRRYRQAMRLKQHMKTHSSCKVPSFVCSECGRAFMWRKNLKYHLEKTGHVGEVKLNEDSL